MSKAIRENTPSELRALDVLDHVPPGCKLELVIDRYNSPHLKPGEFAVVDLINRDFIPRELYLVRWDSGRRGIYQVTRRQHRAADGEFTGIWFSPLHKPRYLANGDIDWNHPVYMSDGPLRPQYLPEMLMGRVIGVFQAREELASLLLPPPDRQRGIGGPE